MHAWHIILAFGFFAGAPVWVLAGAFLGKWLTLRRMTLRGKSLEAIGANLGFWRLPGESDSSYKSRMTSRITGV